MTIIGIPAPIKSTGHRRLFDALGKVFDVQFKEQPSVRDIRIDAWIFLDSIQSDVNLNLSDRSCYIVINKDQLIPCGESTKVSFSSNSVLPIFLKDLDISCDEAVNLRALPQWIQQVKPIACKGGFPVWAIQETKGAYRHYVAMPLPELPNDAPLFQYFQEERFLQLLPLILFLRSVAENRRWEPPPLHACFMVDDPNLHWPKYGFVDFAEVGRHAVIHDYHMCFATIPLDSWFTHDRTASLFRRFRNRMSLLVHGNDHVNRELARAYSAEEGNLILGQALNRIARLEVLSGLEVSRVMAPPHGACSEMMLSMLAHVGFEAACVSRGSLCFHNRQAEWVRTFGMRPSDIIASLPVFPRFGLSRTSHNSILIAALLHQPIIPVGHHHDFRDGLQVLGDLSAFINSLGNVHWADMKGISRAYFSRRRDGDSLHIKMHTKHIEVIVAEGINEMHIERSWPQGETNEVILWRAIGKGEEWKLQTPGAAIPVLHGQVIEIVSCPISLSHEEREQAKRLHLWPVVRRQITEIRDRMAPVIRKIAGR